MAGRHGRAAVSKDMSESDGEKLSFMTLLPLVLDEEDTAWERGHVAGNLMESFSQADSFATDTVGATLLRHGGTVRNIHKYFSQFESRQCQVSSSRQGARTSMNNVRVPKFHRQDSLWDADEEGSFTKLSPEVAMVHKLTSLDYEVYRQAFLCAQYPKLCVPDPPRATPQPSPPPTASSLPFSYRRQRSLSLLSTTTTTSTLTALSDAEESALMIPEETLCELLRQAFGLSRERAAKYEENIYKSFKKKSPKKILAEELNNQLMLLENNAHPYYCVNCFVSPYAYDQWQTGTFRLIISLIEKVWAFSRHQLKNSAHYDASNHHRNYKHLLEKLISYEMSFKRAPEHRRDAMLQAPLSTASIRLLKEMGLRYGVGEMYQKVVHLRYLSERFEDETWYMRYVQCVLLDILEMLPVNYAKLVITKKELKILSEAANLVFGQCENYMKRIKKLFPLSPAEGVGAVIELFDCVMALLGYLNRQKQPQLATVLLKYVKENFTESYKELKQISLEELRLDPTQQTKAPKLLSRLVGYLEKEVNDYKQQYHEVFRKYLDVTGEAAHSFYQDLMADVVTLCKEHLKNHSGEEVDIEMVSFAYCLNSLDQKWADYIPIRQQTWRKEFLPEALKWIDVLEYKCRVFVKQAVGTDKFFPLHVPDMSSSLNDVDTMPMTPETPAILLGSFNSAFDQVRPSVPRYVPSNVADGTRPSTAPTSVLDVFSSSSGSNHVHVASKVPSLTSRPTCKPFSHDGSSTGMDHESDSHTPLLCYDLNELRTDRSSKSAVLFYNEMNLQRSRSCPELSDLLKHSEALKTLLQERCESRYNAMASSCEDLLSSHESASGATGLPRDLGSLEVTLEEVKQGRPKLPKAQPVMRQQSAPSNFLVYSQPLKASSSNSASDAADDVRHVPVIIVNHENLISQNLNKQCIPTADEKVEQTHLDCATQVSLVDNRGIPAGSSPSKGELHVIKEEVLSCDGDGNESQSADRNVSDESVSDQTRSSVQALRLRDSVVLLEDQPAPTSNQDDSRSEDKAEPGQEQQSDTSCGDTKPGSPVADQSGLSKSESVTTEQLSCLSSTEVKHEPSVTTDETPSAAQFKPLVDVDTVESSSPDHHNQVEHASHPQPVDSSTPYHPKAVTPTTPDDPEPVAPTTPGDPEPVAPTTLSHPQPLDTSTPSHPQPADSLSLSHPQSGTLQSQTSVSSSGTLSHSSSSQQVNGVNGEEKKKRPRRKRSRTNSSQSSLQERSLSRQELLREAVIYHSADEDEDGHQSDNESSDSDNPPVLIDPYPALAEVRVKRVNAGTPPSSSSPSKGRIPPAPKAQRPRVTPSTRFQDSMLTINIVEASNNITETYTDTPTSAGIYHLHTPHGECPTSGSVVDITCLLQRLVGFARVISQMLYPVAKLQGQTEYNDLMSYQRDTRKLSESEDPIAAALLEYGEARMQILNKLKKVMSVVVGLYGDNILAMDLCGMKDVKARQLVTARLVTAVQLAHQREQIWGCRHVRECRTSCFHFHKLRAKYLGDRFEPISQQMCVRINNMHSMAESAPSILRQMQRRMEEEKLKELPLRNIVGQGSRRESLLSSPGSPARLETPLSVSTLASYQSSGSRYGAPPPFGYKLKNTCEALMNILAYRVNLFCQEALVVLTEIALPGINMQQRLRPLMDFLDINLQKLREWLYPVLFHNITERLWTLIAKDVQAMASSLRNQLDGTMEAAVKLLQVIAFLLKFFHEHDPELSLDVLAQQVEKPSFWLQLYSQSTSRLISLYKQLYVWDASRKPSTETTPNGTSLPSRRCLYTMRHELHAEKKCFSGIQLVQWLMSHWHMVTRSVQEAWPLPDEQDAREYAERMLSAGIITPVSQPQEQRAHRLSHATLPMPGCPYPHTDGGNLLSSSLCSEESKQFFRNPSMVPEGLLNSDCNSSDQGSVNDPALVMGSTAATIGSSRGDMIGLEDSMKIDSDDDQVAALNEELPKTPIRQHRASTTELMNNKAALSGNLSGAGMARSQSLVNCSHKDWNSGSSQSSQTTSSNFLFLCSNKRFYRFASFIEDLDLSDLTDNTSSHGGSPRWSPVETAQARPTTPEDQAKQEQLGKVMEVYQENGVTSDFILDILRSRRRTDREANEFLWYLCQQDWHDFNEYDDVGFTFGCLSFR